MSAPLTPAFLNRLSDETVAAYGRWSDALVAKSEHVLDCVAGCNDLIVACPAGHLLAEEERRCWADWYALRTAEESGR